MLERYTAENTLRFHMPGHKGLAERLGGLHDLTEVPGTDSLFDPREGILEAQEEAACAWGAARSFLLVNGSTCGVHAMVLWAKTQGRRLLLSRDCHVSALYACALADIQPVWMEPGWNACEQLLSPAGLPHIAKAAKYAVLCTYPDYYGRCSDLGELNGKLSGYDAALLVDNAHGAHFAFSKKLPEDAGTHARMWASGAHKTLPAPTQTAFLHLRRVSDAPDVSRLLRGITTTSPSYLLMEGLDDARAAMQHCGDRLDALVEDCLQLAERLNGIGGLRCWRDGDVCAMGYSGYDPTRLVVDVRGLGFSGWEAGIRLRALGLQVEMSDFYRVVLIATLMDGRARLDEAYKALLKLADQGNTQPVVQRLEALPPRGQAAMTIRQAWLSEACEIALESSAGRIATEPFGAYPPGIPLCMPGEEITPEIVFAVQEAQALGGTFFGIRDGKIMVVNGLLQSC
jgi:arginine/lysine/ornithine decarboxylase